jgi:hypothetical protein
MLWIRNAFNADQDPTFNLNANLGSESNADSCGLRLSNQKFNFYIKIYSK